MPAGARFINTRLSAASWITVVALAAHLSACLVVMPPSVLFRLDPLLSGDYPTHSHRLHIYRSALRESGRPWGCDPALSAGLVTSPTEDIGSKPQQIIGAVLPIVPATQIIRWFAFLALACLPLGLLMACRTLSIPASARNGALIALLFLFWTNSNMVLAYRWGMIPFAAASFLSPWVLAIIQRYAEEPNGKRAGALFIGLTSLFALHLLGPLMIAVPLVFLLARRNVPAWKWKVLALAMGLAAVLVNLFWFVPFLNGYARESSAWGNAALPGHTRDLTFASIADLRIHDRHIRAASFIRGFLLLGAIPFTRRIAGKTTGRVFGLAAVATLVIMLIGSFVPILKHVQPLRFMMPWTAMICIPVGCFLAWLMSPPGRRFAPAAIVAFGIVVAFATSWKRPPAAGYDDRVTLSTTTRDFQLPLRLAPPDPIEEIESARPLARYIRENTEPSDRILVQTRLKTDPMAFELWWGREVAGCTYPDLADPLHFDRQHLLGRPIGDWIPLQLRAALDLWGITKVVAWSAQAASVMESTLGRGEPVGEYMVFSVLNPPARFLVGSGEARAGINRIELTNIRPADGYAVIRYRFHPAWHTDPPSEIVRHSIPGSHVGFIGLRDPPPQLTLRFDPANIFDEPFFRPAP